MAMRPPTARASQRGAALVAILVAALVWSTGAAALLRWTVWLMQTERAAAQTRAAALALENASEQGSLRDALKPKCLTVTPSR